MTSSIGRLLTPFTQVTWGDLELSEWDYGDGTKRPVVFDVEFSLQQGDEKVNNASMSFDPSPVGFRAYVKCTDKDNIQKPVKIKFGYENGSFLECSFYYQDVEFVTGSEQSIRINMAGLHKAAMTSSWWTEYIGDGTKEFTLKELWDTVAKKIGYEVVWSKEAEKKLQGLPKITQAAIVKETIGTYLIRTAKSHGFYLEWPSGSEKDHKKVLVKIGALDAKSNEVLKVVEKDANSGKMQNGSDRIDERYAFILGPTLVGSVSRKTKPQASTGKSYADTAHAIRRGALQDTSAGQLNSQATRPTNPSSTTKSPSSTTSGPSSLQTLASGSTDPTKLVGGSSAADVLKGLLSGGGKIEGLAAGVVTPPAQLTGAAKKRGEDIGNRTETVPNVQSTAAPTAIDAVVGGQAQKKPPGASTPVDKDTKSCVDKNGKKFEGAELEKCLKSLTDAKKKKEAGELSECSCEVFMVPYMVGIQPKDFICFPSLNQQDPYIEDWEVSSVSYKQQGAAVVISLSGQRPKPGADTLIVEGDLKKLQDRVVSMKTLHDWESYYWSI